MNSTRKQFTTSGASSCGQWPTPDQRWLSHFHSVSHKPATTRFKPAWKRHNILNLCQHVLMHVAACWNICRNVEATAGWNRRKDLTRGLHATTARRCSRIHHLVSQAAPASMDLPRPSIPDLSHESTVQNVWTAVSSHLCCCTSVAAWQPTQERSRGVCQPTALRLSERQLDERAMSQSRLELSPPLPDKSYDDWTSQDSEELHRRETARAKVQLNTTRCRRRRRRILWQCEAKLYAWRFVDGSGSSSFVKGPFVKSGLRRTSTSSLVTVEASWYGSLRNQCVCCEGGWMVKAAAGRLQDLTHRPRVGQSVEQWLSVGSQSPLNCWDLA